MNGSLTIGLLSIVTIGIAATIGCQQKQERDLGSRIGAVKGMSEENTWKTNNSPSLSGKYQNEEFDGFNDYPQPINGLGTGFLFNRPLGSFTGSIPPASGSGQQASKGFRVGSPFHNYFGLKKGKSAMNLFITKYMFNADLNG